MDILRNRSAVSTRRGFLLAASGSLSLASAWRLAAGSAFWKNEEPSSWTTDQVLELVTNSPWATKARVLPKPRRDHGSLQPFDPEVAGGRRGGRGNGPEPVVKVQEATVVWESAAPLLEALKSHFPSDFANHYVIGIKIIPWGPGTKPLNQQNLLATLVRGKDSVDAGSVAAIHGGTEVIFGFLKELMPLTAADKEVLFSMIADQFSIRARFSLKEMRYRGMLAV